MITDRDYKIYINLLAREYGKTVKEIEKIVKEKPELLQGYIEHLETDYKDLDEKYHKNYRNNYYE